MHGHTAKNWQQWNLNFSSLNPFNTWAFKHSDQTFTAVMRTNKTMNLKHENLGRVHLLIAFVKAQECIEKIEDLNQPVPHQLKRKTPKEKEEPKLALEVLMYSQYPGSCNNC